jgi:hypothetical protein
MEDTYVQLMNCRLNLFRSSASSFSSQYLLLFFSNHLGAVFFFFLLLSLPLFVLQWHYEGGNFFSEYDQSNWLFYIGYYLEVSSSLLYGRTCSLVPFSGHFIFSIFLQHHISKLSKYFRSNFLSVQVSEPYKAMLQIYHLTNFFLSSMFSLLVKSDIFSFRYYLFIFILKNQILYRYRLLIHTISLENL